MTAKILNLPVTAQLECSECGAPGKGSCRCNAPYVPARQRAAVLAKADPWQSTRDLADAADVSQSTAMRALAEARSTEPHGSVRGRDNKTRRLPQRPEEPSRPTALAYARAHFREVMRTFKKELNEQDWKELIEWLRNQKW